jgi:hypothetical protein
MNRRECDLYDKVTLHLERLEQGLDLLMHQATRDGEPLPEGFWFIFAGLERAAKKMRWNLKKLANEGRTPLTVVDNGGEAS